MVAHGNVTWAIGILRKGNLGSCPHRKTNKCFKTIYDRRDKVRKIGKDLVKIGKQMALRRGGGLTQSSLWLDERGPLRCELINSYQYNGWYVNQFERCCIKLKTNERIKYKVLSHI